MGGTERGGLQKLCLAFPVASWGPTNAQSHSQGRGFSFCSVCFLFRSTARFWFGPLRADGVWQVRISGATHLCLPQGCGLSFPSPCRSRKSSHYLLASLILSVFSISLSFFHFCFCSFSFCMSLFPSSPLSFSLPLIWLLEFVPVPFLPLCASLIL